MSHFHEAFNKLCYKESQGYFVGNWEGFKQAIKDLKAEWGIKE